MLSACKQSKRNVITYNYVRNLIHLTVSSEMLRTIINDTINMYTCIIKTCYEPVKNNMLLDLQCSIILWLCKCCEDYGRTMVGLW